MPLGGMLIPWQLLTSTTAGMRAAPDTRVGRQTRRVESGG